MLINSTKLSTLLSMPVASVYLSISELNMTVMNYANSWKMLPHDIYQSLTFFHNSVSKMRKQIQFKLNNIFDGKMLNKTPNNSLIKQKYAKQSKHYMYISGACDIPSELASSLNSIDYDLLNYDIST